MTGVRLSLMEQLQNKKQTLTIIQHQNIINPFLC